MLAWRSISSGRTQQPQRPERNSSLRCAATMGRPSSGTRALSAAGALECVSLLPLCSRELARGPTTQGTAHRSTASKLAEEKRQQAAALQIPGGKLGRRPRRRRVSLFPARPSGNCIRGMPPSTSFITWVTYSCQMRRARTLELDIRTHSGAAVDNSPLRGELNQVFKPMVPPT